VCNCFISDGNYEYVLLGNFEKIDSTKVVRLSNNFIEATAYYFIDDVSVRQLPYDVSNLEKEITFCHTEDHIELNAYVNGATEYLWPDGSTSNNYFDEIRSSHKTTVKIFFNECSYEHTFKIDYVPDVDLGADTLLCLGETLLLSPDYPSSELIWSDGSTDSARLITSPGTYAVEVPGSCPVMDTVTVNFIDCPGFVPNVFTPNKDEYNPVFQVENIQNRTWSLQVFNRWGKKVYESEKYTNDWDGATLPEGIYYYLLYSPELDNKVKGWVKIIREKG
jgi:gliding motility-associated-like protein